MIRLVINEDMLDTIGAGTIIGKVYELSNYTEPDVVELVFPQSTLARKKAGRKT